MSCFSPVETGWVALLTSELLLVVSISSPPRLVTCRQRTLSAQRGFLLRMAVGLLCLDAASCARFRLPGRCLFATHAVQEDIANLPCQSLSARVHARVVPSVEPIHGAEQSH